MKKHNFTVFKKTFPAFTIAEILIVISIIGFIAMFVLPKLAEDNQKREYVNGLKKFYTTFYEVLRKVSSDHGCIDDLACSGIFLYNSDNQAQNIERAGNEIASHLKVSKNCLYSRGEGCRPSRTFRSLDSSLDNVLYADRDNDYAYNFITTDGMSVEFSSLASPTTPNCDMHYFAGDKGPATKLCGVVTVDVNGLKRPNRYGRDTFSFYITNYNGILLYPSAGRAFQSWWDQPTPKWCNPKGASNTEKSGEYCTAKVIDQSWQMTY